MEFEVSLKFFVLFNYAMFLKPAYLQLRILDVSIV